MALYTHYSLQLFPMWDNNIQQALFTPIRAMNVIRVIEVKTTFLCNNYHN